MLQYLLDCDDKSLCVIYKRSIIIDNEDNGSIAVGQKVRFLWPEDSPKAQEYTGTILASDRK